MTSRVSNLLCNPTKFRFLEMQKKRFTENELQSSAGGRDGQITSTFSLIWLWHRRFKSPTFLQEMKSIQHPFSPQYRSILFFLIYIHTSIVTDINNFRTVQKKKKKKKSLMELCDTETAPYNVTTLAFLR